MPITNFGNDTLFGRNPSVLASDKPKNLSGVLCVPRVFNELGSTIAIKIVKKGGFVVAGAGINKLVNRPCIDAVLAGSRILIPMHDWKCECP